MTDQRLRDLERDAALGDLQAQVRLLLERVRIGDLTEERLQLAAYLGDPAAALAARTTPLTPEGSPWEYLRDGLTHRWLAGVEQFSFEALARGVVAAAGAIEARTTPTSARIHKCPRDGGDIPPHGCDDCWVGPRYAAVTAAEWLRQPSEAHHLRLQSQLWFPEFEVEAVRAAVRQQLVPWALRPREAST